MILLFFHETRTKSDVFYFDPFKGVRHIVSCFRIKGLGRLYMYYLVMMMGWGINLLWLNPYTLSRYPVSHELLFGLLASTGIVWSLGSSVVNEYLIKRYHTRHVALIGTGGLVIVFTLCSLMTTFIPFAILALLASIFGALAWTNALSTISLTAPEETQGKVMGFLNPLPQSLLCLLP